MSVHPFPITKFGPEPSARSMNGAGSTGPDSDTTRVRAAFSAGEAIFAWVLGMAILEGITVFLVWFR